MDEIIKISEEISTSYKSRKGLTWEQIGGETGWVPAEIKDYKFVEGKGDMPIYHIGTVTKVFVEEQKAGKIYKVNYENDFNDYVSVKTPFSHSDNNKEKEFNCHLCGHGIKNPHYLINYTKKQYMQVGSECISNSHGQVVRKKIKEFKMNENRNKFISLLPEVISYLDTCYDISEKYTNEHNEYAIRNKRLEFWAYNLKNQLNKIIVEKTGNKKIENKIKQMENILANKKEKTIKVKEFARNISDIIKFKEQQKLDVEITFGKYKNKTINEIDDAYFAWIKSV